MIERFVIAIIFLGICFSLYKAITHYQLKHIQKQQAQDPIIQGLQKGIPAIVYFTTPGCMPCKTQQKPALNNLVSEWGNQLQIVEIDASLDLDSANRWGVLSAPTTFILNQYGKAVAVNNGVASSDKLSLQLKQAMV
ncbi:thioredoxin family protein [Anaerolineales bacterium]